MSIWDLRMWIEKSTPWWVPFASILLVVMVCGWLDFCSYRKKLK